MDAVNHGIPVSSHSSNRYGSLNLLLASYGTLEAAHGQLTVMRGINSYKGRSGFVEGVGSELSLKEVCKLSG